MKSIDEGLYDYVLMKAFAEDIRIPLQDAPFRNAVAEYVEDSGIRGLAKSPNEMQDWSDFFDAYFVGMTAQHIIEAISYGRILAEFNAHSKALFMVAITKKWVGDTERSAIKHFERIRELAHLLEGKLDIAEELSECWLDYQYILADPTKPVSSLSFRLGREIRYREHTKEAI